MSRFACISTTVLACVVGVCPASAQGGGVLEALQGHLSIRQSLKDKNTINEPALVVLTIPDEGATANQVAAALTALLKSDADSPRFNIGAALQFNQNSAADSRQNVFVGGAEFSLRGGSSDPSAPFFFPRLAGTSGYKRNGEKHTSGLTANAYLTYEKNRPDEDSSSIPLSRWLEFTPQVGLEFDRVVSAQDVADEGKVTRGLVALKVNVFPLPARIKERLVFSADVAFRRDLQTDFAADGQSYRFAQFSLAITLDPYNIFSVAVDRLIGVDPTQDFSGPDFTRIALKVQLTKPQRRAIVRTNLMRRHVI
jgi:hypothetical protein